MMSNPSFVLATFVNKQNIGLSLYSTFFNPCQFRLKLGMDDVAMDFFIGLPMSAGYTVIMIVIDRLSKYAHFGPLRKGFTVAKATESFLHMLSGTALSHSLAYHPQMHSIAEVTNHMLEQSFVVLLWTRCRGSLISYVELFYNTSFHSAAGTTSFKLVYGRDPPLICLYAARESKLDAMENMLATCDSILRELKYNLLCTQQRMVRSTNKHIRFLEFQEGDLVYLKLQPYRQLSICGGTYSKLGR
ncbi:hypothetical protein Pint_04736 [Pistacia integerrima]|uniref:Uncharacterized protein n=1 Tax=Pistacia integerrima TaxID=434235 RepID=A0ACC0Z1R3_9ROSI|nr:hypothetical protein Pint_04736 [Pistacia integerrima]